MGRLVRGALVCALFIGACQTEVDAGTAPIIDGTAVSASQRYGTVGLQLPLDKGEVCTGTLIRPTVVVTAAHCVVDTDDFDGTIVDRRTPDEITVVAGGTVLREGDPTFEHDVATIIVHERYPNLDFSGDPSSLGNHEDDIALVVLTEPATGLVPVEVLPMADVARVLVDGTRLTISGFGARRVEGFDPVDIGELHIAETPYIDRSERELLIGAADESDTQPDSCVGDSGGPAYWLEGSTPYLVGASSRARTDGFAGREQCGSGGIYTLVPAFTGWIAEKLGEPLPDAGVAPGGDGGTTPPATDGDMDDGGCGCRLSSRGGTRAGPMLVLVALAWVGRRGRRRHS